VVGEYHDYILVCCLPTLAPREIMEDQKAKIEQAFEEQQQI